MILIVSSLRALQRESFVAMSVLLLFQMKSTWMHDGSYFWPLVSKRSSTQYNIPRRKLFIYSKLSGFFSKQISIPLKNYKVFWLKHHLVSLNMKFDMQTCCSCCQFSVIAVSHTAWSSWHFLYFIWYIKSTINGWMCKFVTG